MDELISGHLYKRRDGDILLVMKIDGGVIAYWNVGYSDDTTMTKVQNVDKFMTSLTKDLGSVTIKLKKIFKGYYS